MKDKAVIIAGKRSIPCATCENIFHAPGLVRDAIDKRSILRYYCDDCVAYEPQAICIRRIRNSRKNTDLLNAL